MAIGGSTNAIIHLVAMAGRCGLKLPLERFDEISRTTPVLANIRPSGAFLMEDFYYAGGLRALMARDCGTCLHLDCLTVNGKTLGENIAGARGIQRQTSSAARDKPLSAGGRHRDPPRQPRARRRGDQADRPRSRA